MLFALRGGGRLVLETNVAVLGLLWRRVVGAGFALPRDAAQRSAFRAGGVIRGQEGCAFRPPPADGAGGNTGVPGLGQSGRRRC